VEAFCNSGGVYVQNGAINSGYGPAMYFKWTPRSGGGFHSAAITTVENVWIENGFQPDSSGQTWRPSDTIVIDGFRSLVLERCYATGGHPSNPDTRILRLRRGASNNIIRDNYFAYGGQDLHDGSGLTSGDRIEIESGCAFNLLQNNLSARSVDNGVPVTVGGSLAPRERTQMIGHRQMIGYSESQPPQVAGWRVGDIVFRTNPSSGGFVGWVLVGPDSSPTWKEFGQIS